MVTSPEKIRYRVTSLTKGARVYLIAAINPCRSLPTSIQNAPSALSSPPYKLNGSRYVYSLRYEARWKRNDEKSDLQLAG